MSRALAKLVLEGKAEVICFNKIGYFKVDKNDFLENHSREPRIKFLVIFAKFVLSASPHLYNRIQEFYMSIRMQKVQNDAPYLTAEELMNSKIILPEIPSRRRVDYLASHVTDLNINLVFWVYDVLPYTHAKYFNGTSILEIIHFRNLLNTASSIIVNSNHVKHEIERLFPEMLEANISVIPLPSSIKSVKNMANCKSEIDYFVMVGSIEPRKNHLLAIKGFLIYLKQNPGSELHFVYNKSWKTKRIFILVYILRLFGKKVCLKQKLSDDEIGLEITGSVALLFLSLEEGYGLPVIESLSLGVPVVVLDKPPMSAFATYGGVLICQNSPEDVGRAMAQLADRVVRGRYSRDISLPIFLSDWSEWWIFYEKEILQIE